MGRSFIFGVVRLRSAIRPPDPALAAPCSRPACQAGSRQSDVVRHQLTVPFGHEIEFNLCGTECIETIDRRTIGIIDS